MKVFFRVAGLICFSTNQFYIHLLVRRSHWQIGYRREDWAWSFGIGPLFVVYKTDF